MAQGPLERFLASLAIDAESWRDGAGYDLAAIDEADAAERGKIEAALLARGVSDPRDVEALARLATPKAHAALKAAAKADGARLCGALLCHAADLFSVKERDRLLVSALREAELYDGLGAALDLVPGYRTPEVEAALLDGCLTREPDIAVSFAAMLLFLHGQAEEPFDDAVRPFVLRFATDDAAKREAAHRELQARLKDGK